MEQGLNHIQKDGSYSVIPRMWGGETMERLKRSSTKTNMRWGWITLSVNPRIFSTKW